MTSAFIAFHSSFKARIPNEMFQDARPPQKKQRLTFEEFDLLVDEQLVDLGQVLQTRRHAGDGFRPRSILNLSCRQQQDTPALEQQTNPTKHELKLIVRFYM